MGSPKKRARTGLLAALLANHPIPDDDSSGDDLPRRRRSVPKASALAPPAPAEEVDGDDLPRRRLSVPAASSLAPPPSAEELSAADELSAANAELAALPDVELVADVELEEQAIDENDLENLFAPPAVEEDAETLEDLLRANAEEGIEGGEIEHCFRSPQKGDCRPSHIRNARSPARAES